MKNIACLNFLEVSSPHFRASLALALLACLTQGCVSLEKIAINKMGDALASGGTTFTSDEDPELVGAAMPFSLKLMETLLEQVPGHKGLLYATASGFTQYGYAFVQQEADRLEDTDLDAAFALRSRAQKLYLRARNYGLRGLDVSMSGFQAGLRENPQQMVQKAAMKDVPLLYWTASAWISAIAISKEADLIGDLPIVDALIDRALELDESYDYGAIHSFLITYEMNRSKDAELPEIRSRRHYKRAVELSDGLQAGPHVALAEAVSIPNQNRAEFRILLNKALAIDTDLRPEWRLSNLIYQRRAQWLLDRIERYFL